MKPLKSTLALVTGTWILFSCANSPSTEFNQANLIGTWDLIRLENRDNNTDAIIDTALVPPGLLYFSFNNDGTGEANLGDTIFTYNYLLETLNNKNMIIFMLTGDPDYDTIEVTRFTETEMDFTDKPDVINDPNDNDYNNYFFIKE